MNLTPAHIHLMLNHVPISGTIVGLLLLLAGIVRRSDEVKRLSLAAFVLSALITVPVYLTGEGAEEVAKNLPAVTEALIERHQDAALISFVGVGVLGAVAMWGLWSNRRESVLPSRLITASLVLSIVVSGLMVWTGGLGGQIRHSEVRADYIAPGGR